MSDPVLGTMDMQKQVAEKVAGGIPLTVVGTGDGQVVFEDPDGVTFQVPQAWVSHDVENNFDLDHTKIDKAPPGELENIWRMATYRASQDQDPGGFGGETASASSTTSLLDDWNNGTWKPMTSADVAARRAENIRQATLHMDDEPPAYGRGGVPVQAEKSTSLPPWNPSVAKGLKNPNPTGVTQANAGSNFGNWDETWDGKRGMWVNKYTGKARKP